MTYPQERREIKEIFEAASESACLADGGPCAAKISADRAFIDVRRKVRRAERGRGYPKKQ